MTASANSEDAVSATPPQRFKAAPPGDVPREHRAGPRSGHPAGLRPRGGLNRIGSAFPLPQPVLRCKRRSQLSRDRTPVRPYVLHSRPCRYGEGDIYAIAEGLSYSSPSLVNASVLMPTSTPTTSPATAGVGQLPSVFVHQYRVPPAALSDCVDLLHPADFGQGFSQRDCSDAG